MSECRRMSNKYLLFLVVCLLWLTGCGTKEDKRPDRPGQGAITISVDESFKPVIDEMVQVFESNKPGTKIKVLYKPEAECFKDLEVDSIRMIIATRRYNEYEKQFIVDSFNISPESLVVARDAITVIVNPKAPDSLFTMDDLRAILQGRFKKNLIPVFDGVKATSTVRFIIDSVLRGDSLTSKAVAARSSEGVIDYVSKTPDAIGFIGVSWIGNSEDPGQLSFLKKVRVAGIESSYKGIGFVKAYQQNIYTKSYPLVRDLVYTLKENYKGLGFGFAAFMSGDIGQLIFRRAYLVPQVLKNFGIRSVEVEEQ
ncbi:MAG: phosphate ABC transporter substrate-binding protein, PhoT family [Chitinophagaceae bacterium]|nr:phosphate ABC transporter substrate-binding protein, PhoT family [Chitinophagaceae bacterium]